MFTTFVIVVCIVAIVVDCFAIYKLVRALDSVRKDYDETTRLREARHQQAISDLEKAIEMLHAELEKTRTDGGTNNQ